MVEQKENSPSLPQTSIHRLFDSLRETPQDNTTARGAIIRAIVDISNRYFERHLLQEIKPTEN